LKKHVNVKHALIFKNIEEDMNGWIRWILENNHKEKA
jgi:hypothetical protein